MSVLILDKQLFSGTSSLLQTHSRHAPASIPSWHGSMIRYFCILSAASSSLCSASITLSSILLMPKDKSKPAPRGSSRNSSSRGSKGKSKPQVRFTATADKDKGKHRGSPSETGSSTGTARKKARTAAGAQDSTGQGTSTAAGTASGSGATTGTTDGTQPSNPGLATNADQGSTGAAGDTVGAEAEDGTPTQKRLRNPWGIQPKEVEKGAKPTQRAFQRVIRALCGLLTQHDILPSAEGKLNHYDKRFDKVDDMRFHMRTLVDQSRTAVREATERAKTVLRDAERASGPIANDIARIPAAHLSTVFTMVQKAGLQGFCPDVEGPVQSGCNQLHRHLAVAAFQFLSSSFGLMGLNVNNEVAHHHNLLEDMYNNFVYGTLAQNTKMERRRPGSLSQSQKNSTAYKTRTRLATAQFNTAHTLKLRKPVQRMVYINEVHSDDEHDGKVHRVREKTGRNPIVTKFLLETLDVKTEEYRKCNMRSGQKGPPTRQRDDPLLPTSDIGLILPPNVPIDFFTPEFYNSLTVKERARYVTTGVAFPLAQYAFNESHAQWMSMGKAEFMKAYGNEVLSLYNVPSAEEITELSDSDAGEELDDEEEIDLADTDNEMDVDEQEVAGMV
ncbi:hypothetical protein MSAN_01532800 [Mycena sanguinolenta]|uniref:Uncharacterized protein n=1 Tax=Mycena sanguinolenta TaxID=230812 RepID=A0A8H6Y7R2_9AGAR|nr:hypothetical protein MSAN_01532800 [Mycena sanguinolenta]